VILERNDVRLFEIESCEHSFSRKHGTCPHKLAVIAWRLSLTVVGIHQPQTDAIGIVPLKGYSRAVVPPVQVRIRPEIINVEPNLAVGQDFRSDCCRAIGFCSYA